MNAGRPTEAGAPLNVPLVPAANFIIGNGREYSRDDGTLTWEALEQVIGGLEGGRAVAFSSGMVAIAAVFDPLPVGSKAFLPDDCYQGVAGLVAEGAARGRWTVDRLPMADTAAWIDACRSADLLWLESPSKPLLEVADLETICAAPRKPTAVVAVDNTFATSLNHQPLDYGATVSIQSATKFIGGHSYLLAGVATTRDNAGRRGTTVSFTSSERRASSLVPRRARSSRSSSCGAPGRLCSGSSVHRRRLGFWPRGLPATVVSAVCATRVW